MREIARSITVNIQKRRVTMKALSWQEHLAQGHVPFRKDCAVCQRAAARDRPHRAQGIAAPCVLSLDLTGPFVLGHDIDITFLKQGGRRDNKDFVAHDCGQRPSNVFVARFGGRHSLIWWQAAGQYPPAHPTGATGPKDFRDLVAGAVYVIYCL